MVAASGIGGEAAAQVFGFAAPRIHAAFASLGHQRDGIEGVGVARLGLGFVAGLDQEARDEQFRAFVTGDGDPRADRMIQQSVRNAAYELMSDLTYARSEAVKRNGSVTVSKSPAVL